MEMQEKELLSKNLKLDLHSRNSSLRKVRAWKRKKKHRRSRKFLFYIFDWHPGIISLLRTRESSLFSGRECANARGTREAMDIFITTLILFTVLLIVMLMRCTQQLLPKSVLRNGCLYECLCSKELQPLQSLVCLHLSPHLVKLQLYTLFPITFG